MVTSNLKSYFKDISIISILYVFLFALCIISINPWGQDRAEIWTEPKLLIIKLIIILNMSVFFGCWRKKTGMISPAWRIESILWILFLSIGATSTILSPSPWRSVLGQIEIGDGLIYWCFIAVFVVSNALVIQLKPKLARYQLYGLLFGGVILAIAIFIQVYDWRIDFTATSGQIGDLHPQLLKSRIWRLQMPIGFYTNRGEAALPLAVEAVLTLLGLLWGWISAPVAGAIYVLVCTALFYTKCRGALLGLLVAITYLLICFRSNSIKRLRIICYGFGLLLVSYFAFRMSAIVLTPEFTTRASPRNFKLDIGSLDSSLGRLQYWKLSLKGIAKRPLFGWGFDGFALAFPYIADWAGQHRGYLPEKVDVSEILSIGNFSFKYLGTDGMVHTGMIMVTKVHNLILDTILSVGILGFVSYMAIFAFSIWCAFNSTFMGIEATAIAYLVYTMTWYESGQFSHMGWWGLSIGLGYTKLFQSNKNKKELS